MPIVKMEKKKSKQSGGRKSKLEYKFDIEKSPTYVLKASPKGTFEIKSVSSSNSEESEENDAAANFLRSDNTGQLDKKKLPELKNIPKVDGNQNYSSNLSKKSPELETKADGNQNLVVPTKSVWESAGPKLIPMNYMQQGIQTLTSRDRRIRILLDERKWPKEPWDDLTIEMFIAQLAAMDSNNFITKIGVGEREARIFSSLVEKRHYRLCHGVGRSGDLGEPQPKAIGSSLMSSLVNNLVLDVCKQLISSKVSAAFLCPMATGMSIVLVLLALKREKPKAKFVVWPRIDQKSCFKSIITAGLEPLVIEGILTGNEVQTNIDELITVVKVYGADNILCFLTTTSCFAPRVPDSLEPVSKICYDENIYHVVNNAYGLQSSGCSHQILEGSEAGRLDVFVQSTDKNLMVPVGGAIIAGFNKDLVQKIRQTYAGRASSSQTLDILITLLSMGSSKYNDLLLKCKENFVYLKQSMEELAIRFGERVINTPHNRISIAMSLSNLAPELDLEPRGQVLTQLGAMLFRRNVAGCRVVTGIELKVVEGHQFRGWGSHCNNYPSPYLTAAATIGMERNDTDNFIRKLDECYRKLQGTFGPKRTLSYEFNQVDTDD